MLTRNFEEDENESDIPGEKIIAKTKQNAVTKEASTKPPATGKSYEIFCQALTHSENNRMKTPMYSFTCAVNTKAEESSHKA